MDKQFNINEEDLNRSCGKTRIVSLTLFDESDKSYSPVAIPISEESYDIIGKKIKI